MKFKSGDLVKLSNGQIAKLCRYVPKFLWINSHWEITLGQQIMFNGKNVWAFEVTANSKAQEHEFTHYSNSKCIKDKLGIV